MLFFFLIKKTGAHLQYVCNNCAKFQIDCLKLWKELIIQTCHPVLELTHIFSKFEKAVILSKILFDKIKKAGAHLQYVCNNCEKSQIDA